VSAKAAVGALVGGLGGATIAVLGKSILTRDPHPESFDASVAAGMLAFAIVGAWVGDSIGVTPDQSAAITPTTTPHA
jgi:hypothetical protein